MVGFCGKISTSKTAGMGIEWKLCYDKRTHFGNMDKAKQPILPWVLRQQSGGLGRVS
jgi:hypothetical protein